MADIYFFHESIYSPSGTGAERSDSAASSACSSGAEDLICGPQVPSIFTEVPPEATLGNCWNSSGCAWKK
jgi:hypothetical protein